MRDAGGNPPPEFPYLVVEKTKTIRVPQARGVKVVYTEKRRTHPFPFLSVEDGEFKLLISNLVVTAPATRSGAKAIGRQLRNCKAENLLYSSSVDFPADHGGDDLDMRSIIERMF